MTKFADYFCEAGFLQGCECKVKKYLDCQVRVFFCYLNWFVVWEGRRGEMCKMAELGFCGILEVQGYAFEGLGVAKDHVNVFEN